MSIDSMQKRVLSAPMTGLLLRLSVPNVLASSTFVVMLVADGILLGKNGALAIAAAGAVMPMLMLMLQLAGSSYAGTVTAFASKALGAGRTGDANAIASVSLAMAILAGALLAALFALAAPPLLATMSGNAAIASMAYRYGVILFAFAPVIMLGNTVSALLRARGDMRGPAKASLLAALLHVLAVAALLQSGRAAALDIAVPALVFGGAFLASLLWQLADLRKSAYAFFWPRRAHLPLAAQIAKKAVSAATIPVLANGTALLGAFCVARFGPEALAAYAVGIRIEYLVAPIAFGIGLSLLTVVGMNLGAGQTARVRHALWLGPALAATLILALTALVVLFGEACLRALGLSGSALAIGLAFLHSVGLLYAVYAFGMTLFFGAQALGRPELGVFASGMRLLVLAAGAFAVLRSGAGVEALFAAMACALAAYALVMLFSLRQHLWPRGLGVVKAG